MPISPDALLALKAFQIGYAAAASADPGQTLQLLEKAISKLANWSTHEDGVRLAFYLATRAQLLKSVGDPLPDRLALKMLSSDLGISLFDWFMKIEEVTTSKTGEKWNGSTSPYSAGGGTDFDPDNARVSPVGQTKRALRALQLPEPELSGGELRFIEKATLMSILKKHGLLKEAQPDVPADRLRRPLN